MSLKYQNLQHVFKIFKSLKKSQKVQVKMVNQVVISGHLSKDTSIELISLATFFKYSCGLSSKTSFSIKNRHQRRLSKKRETLLVTRREYDLSSNEFP